MKPSPAMVGKLLVLNGIGPKLDGLMREFPLAIASPHLPRLMTTNEAQKYANPKKLQEAFASVYGQHFSADEVLDLIAFYRSPLGQKLAKHDETVRLALLEAATQVAIDIAADMVRDSRNNRT